MIVDSSALLAILRGEQEESSFRSVLESSNETSISAGTLIEARILAISLNVRRELDELISEFGISVVPVDARQAEISADAFAKYGKGRHPARLNFGDLFAYALAKALDEPLLFKGGDFSKTDVEPAI